MNTPSPSGLYQASCAALALIVALSLGACATTDGAQRATPDLPESTWQRGGAPVAIDLDWLAGFDSEALPVSTLVGAALESNFQLAQEAARVEQARQAVIVARADRLPALDASLGTTRREVAGTDTIAEAYDLGVDARWEVDLWGRLSQAQRAAALSLAAQEASFEAARRGLAADIAATMFRVVEARQLLAVFERRLENVSQSLDIVASGYRQGLNEALDLYLAQNSVEQEKSNLAEQRQATLEASTSLQLLLARYPDGDLGFDAELPVIDDPVPVGMPSELLARRADIQRAWLNLLAADADLAAAYRQRFPRLSLVGSAGQTSLELGDLLDGDSIAWSLMTNLGAPLYDAGRLRALAAQAAARVVEAEQQYLDLLYGAFAEVENAISRAASLTDQYNAFLLAEENSAAALELALEQYQRGLVDYTTVLESQRRAFDATTTVVRLRNQRLQNRIALHLAVGGEFTPAGGER